MSQYPHGQPSLIDSPPELFKNLRATLGSLQEGGCTVETALKSITHHLSLCGKPTFGYVSADARANSGWPYFILTGAGKSA